MKEEKEEIKDVEASNNKETFKENFMYNSYMNKKNNKNNKMKFLIGGILSLAVFVLFAGVIGNTYSTSASDYTCPSGSPHKWGDSYVCCPSGLNYTSGNCVKNGLSLAEKNKLSGLGVSCTLRAFVKPDTYDCSKKATPATKVKPEPPKCKTGQFDNEWSCKQVWSQCYEVTKGCWAKKEVEEPKKCLPGQYKDELSCTNVYDKCKRDGNGCWVKEETSPNVPPSNCIAYEGKYPSQEKCQSVFNHYCVKRGECWEKGPDSPKPEEPKKSACYACGGSQGVKYVWSENVLTGCSKADFSTKESCEGQNQTFPTVKVLFTFDGKSSKCEYRANKGGCTINIPDGSWNCPFGKMDGGSSYLVGCNSGETSCQFDCTSSDKPTPTPPPNPPKPPVVVKDYVKVNIYFNNQKDSCTYDRGKGEDRCSITVPSEKNVSSWNCTHGIHKPGEHVSIHCDEGEKECDIRCTGNASSSDNVTVNVYFDDKRETCSYDRNGNPKSCQITIPKHNNVETWYCPYGSHKPNEIVSVHCDEGNTCDVRCNSKTDISNQYDVEFKYSTEKKKTVKFDQEFEVKNPTEKNVTFKLSTNKTGAKIGPFSDSYNLKFNGWTGEKIKAEKALVDGKKWDGKLTLGTKFKSLTDISNTTVYLVANWEEKNVKLPTVVKDGKVCSFNTSEKGKGTKYESEGTYTIKNSTPNVVNLYAICESDSKTDDEITDNEKTGTILITFVWLIGLGTLGYSAYYLKKNKLDM